MRKAGATARVLLINGGGAAVAGRSGELPCERGQVVHAASNRAHRLRQARRCRREAARAAERAAQGSEGFQADRHAGEAARLAGESGRHGACSVSTCACPTWSTRPSSTARCSAARSRASTTPTRRRSPACARSSRSIMRSRLSAITRGPRNAALRRSTSSGTKARARIVSMEQIVDDLANASTARWRGRAQGRRRRTRASPTRRRASTPSTSSRSSRTRRWSRSTARCMCAPTAAISGSARRCRRAPSTRAVKITGLPPEKITMHNHLLGGGFGRRLEVDCDRAGAEDRQAGRRAGQGRLDARRRHPARHVPAVLLRQDLRRARCERQADCVAAPDCRLVDHGALRAAARSRTESTRTPWKWRPTCRTTCRTSSSTTCGRNRARCRRRSGAASVRRAAPFVVESFIDELAAQAKVDPVKYRRDLLGKTPRARERARRRHAGGGLGQRRCRRDKGAAYR